MKANDHLQSDQEWINIIRECHSSGLSARKWCKVSGVSRNSLNYHIRKLREKGYDIPVMIKNDSAYIKQEVVPLVIRDDQVLSENRSPSLKNGSVAARIFIGNACAEIFDGASGSTIREILCTLGGLPC